MTTKFSPERRERIGARIRSVRKEKKLMPPDLAALVGCNFNTVSDYERGIPVKMPLLPRFAIALGLNLEWLETGNGERDALDASSVKPQVVDADFMHRCFTVASDFESAFATPFDRTVLACRLYDTFHGDEVTDEQMQRFLSRFFALELSKMRQ